MSPPALGIYRHYKGGLYRLMMTGLNSEQPEQGMCVYFSLTDGRIWIRPLELWRQEVNWPDGTAGPRFEWVRA